MRGRSSPVFYFIVALGLASFAQAQDARVTKPLDSGWHFRQASDLIDVESPIFNDERWTVIDIPHTWNRIGNAGTERSPLSNDVQGVGWYRLHFKAPHAVAGARYFLQFDAVGTIADVWLNGQYLGKHVGAFARFRFDASPYINSSGDNLLVVKADNSRPQPGATTQDVIPLSGDFFVFGGIYRSVALLVTQPVHVDLMDFGGPGLHARALAINTTAATVQVSGRLVNDAAKPRPVVVDFTIEDALGTVVDSKSIRSTASVGSAALEVRLRVTHPHLWQGMKDPYQYRTTMTIRSETGEVLDRVTEPLGLRTMRFDADHGFFLNGEHLTLKGASMHQDRPVKGWAISHADQQQDFDLLQELGGNAVRLAHYQHDQYSYELADARGVLVWAEIPVVNKVSFDGSPANAALTANARQQLTELVRQNDNHPSIAVWSIGNEVDNSATQIKGPSRPAALLKSLNELVKREDPSRVTTFADCCELGILPHDGSDLSGMAPREAIVGTADTIGYNRYFGWYNGELKDFGVMLDRAHLLHPRLPMAVAEYGAGAALSQHSDDPAGGPINPHGRPHPEEYQNLYHEQSWAQLKIRKYLWGVFIWNLFDFSSDSRNEGDLTDINEKGLVSYDRGTRKDAFYFYRANWNSEPTLHLVGRRYTDRAYAVNDVKAYSNAAAASLTLNGTAIGLVPCVEGICLWRAVHLKSGSNDLVATAQIGGTTVTDALRWTLSHSERVVRIKAGDISGYTSKEGEVYGSDMYFVAGHASGVNPPDTLPADRMSVAARDAPLYETFREGEFAYRVPLPNGRYHLSLKFAEPAAIATGDRVFDVLANQAVLLKDFDILAVAGSKLKGVDRSFDISINNGMLTLAFQPHRGSAEISALSIIPLD